MRSTPVVTAAPPPARVRPVAGGAVAPTFLGEPVRGRALLAVPDRWLGELRAMLPSAEVHRGDVHFVPTSAGPGLVPCSVDLLVVDPVTARLEALRPVLARGGALALVAADGTVRWTRDARAPRPIGRLGGVGR